MNTYLRDRIDWVGYIDWDVRDFHGYHTDRGSTYNAYLIRDEKTVLVDTVKRPHADKVLANIGALTDPSKIDYVVCNHAEPDHSGSLPVVMKSCPRAELVCNAKCRTALEMHYNTAGWRWKVVDDCDSLSIGSRTLTFIETPMVHWPESMFTYVPEEKLLFSMDAFGQHYASGSRFDDEEPLDSIMMAAKVYYANIVMLYGKPISRVLEKASSLDIDMIAPSHGVIWRGHLETILGAYRNWVLCRPRAKVVVMYDTMWQSTAAMARAIADGALSGNAEVRVLNARNDHITSVATEMLDAAVAAFGSPTLNKTLMPQMAAALTYLKGLAPAGKAGFAFGSYGWTNGGAADVERYMNEMKFEILREPIQSQFAPTKEILAECRAAGELLAREAGVRAAKT